MTAGGPAAGAAVERLWLDALQEIGGRSAHEVRNALNGVSVNLEVVRARSAKAGEPSLARFAETAAEQLEALTRITDALITLVRLPAEGPADLAAQLQRLVLLLAPAARAEGGDVALERRGADVVPTALPAAVARPLLATVILAAGARSARLTCELAGDEAPTLRVTRLDASLPSPPPELVALAADAGVRADWRPDGWTMIFPPRAG